MNLIYALLGANVIIPAMLVLIFFILLFCINSKLKQIRNNTAETRYQLMLLNEKYSRVHGLDDDQIIEDIKEGTKHERAYNDFYNEL